LVPITSKKEKKGLKDRDMLVFLKSYIGNHFTLESRLMKAFGYSGVGLHQEQHELYVNAFKKLIN
jgi:hemerythrin